MTRDARIALWRVQRQRAMRASLVCDRRGEKDPRAAKGHDRRHDRHVGTGLR